jgi:hypothetical protein
MVFLAEFIASNTFLSIPDPNKSSLIIYLMSVATLPTNKLRFEGNFAFLPYPSYTTPIPLTENIN